MLLLGVVHDELEFFRKLAHDWPDVPETRRNDTNHKMRIGNFYWRCQRPVILMAVGGNRPEGDDFVGELRYLGGWFGSRAGTLFNKRNVNPTGLVILEGVVTFPECKIMAHGMARVRSTERKSTPPTGASSVASNRP